MASAKIRVVRTTTDNQEVIRRLLEDDGETFKSHTPVALDAQGFVIAWGGTTEDGLVGSIIGIALEAGSNLTTQGVAKTLTFGEVPFMASAVNIPRGAPPNDGRVGVVLARQEVEFKGQINPAGQSLLQTDIGVQYGLTIDTDGQWYIDKTKSNAGVDTCVRITKRDPLEDNLADNVRRSCYFQFVPADVQVLA